MATRAGGHAPRARAILVVVALGAAVAGCSDEHSDALTSQSTLQEEPAAPRATADAAAAGHTEADASGDAAAVAVVGTTPFGTVGRTAGGYLSLDLGCVRSLKAKALDAFFARRLGPVLGLDNPHTYRLDAHRTLWLFHDAYLDYTGTLPGLTGTVNNHNLALLQVDRCFSLLHRGTIEHPASFEQGDAGEFPERFFWPLGGGVSGNTLWIYWAETVTDPAPPALDGLRRHPIGTWLASYDATTLTRTSFRRAPNAGVTPQYGFAVDSDATHTYLFGNSNLLNLSLEGGYDNGPHSATQMYLARVPRGRFDAMPVYRTARGWSADPADAVPISERYWTENTMQPRFTGDGWVAVTKADGFWGSEVVIDVAEHPWGPWRTVATREVQTRYGAAEAVTYQPVLVSWRAGEPLVVVISENAGYWPDAYADPARYRPVVFAIRPGG